MKWLIRTLLGLATWAWVGLLVLVIVPRLVAGDVSPFWVFMDLSTWVLVLVGLVIAFVTAVVDL